VTTKIKIMCVRAAAAATSILLLTGCNDAEATWSLPADASAAPAASPSTPAVRLGAAGSPCRLPVAFELAELWEPEAVDIDKAGELAALLRAGPFEVVCEVDAKPAGEIGFLRVYVAKARTGTPRSHLEAFVAAESPKTGGVEVRNIKYTAPTIGGTPAAEVTYEPYNKALDHKSKYSAFAVNTPQGAVVVKLAPGGADEHANVLPAFELARTSLTVNR
jgi:hypothetical protein